MSTADSEVVGGRYQLGEMLGRGGMAEVRKGTDARLGRAVAVKRLRTDLVDDPTFLARFQREAQASASLNHPSIVAVYDTGDEPTATGTKQPYIVMEYVAGRTLREVLREGRKILPERALEITGGVLSALDYSHRAGIIHRDIKPGNVMLTPAGEVKVMDFGIARAISDASAGMTQTAAVVGTAQYLSPEQARGETVDSRSDVYSTGCLLYELLTGRPPFVGDSPVAVAYQHVREPAMPPSMLDADLPPEVDAIVMKALAKQVEDRYQSAVAMRSDIERFLAGRPVAAPPVEAETSYFPPSPSPTGTQVALPATTRVTEPDERRYAKWLWLLGFLIVATVGLGWYVVDQLTERETDDVEVPSLVGKTEDQATKDIGAADLVVGEIKRQPDPEVPANSVISQDPAQTTFVAPGTKIDLVISTGKPEVAVPFVEGKPRAEARREIRQVGLKVKFVEQEGDAPAGTVVSTNPAAGVEVQAGAVITAYISDGPEIVPSVVGTKKNEAIRILEAAGFRVSVFESGDTEEEKGTVFKQSPAADDTVAADTEVTIFVSTYEPQNVKVPDLVGKTEDEAIAEITAAGLTLGEVTSEASPTVPVDGVISQDPVADSEVAPGTAINLVVSTGPALPRRGGPTP
ncbi:MAG: Stk1 family PASTA domain-containing Ser/Thr kinase [Nocardioides sp.]